MRSHLFLLAVANLTLVMPAKSAELDEKRLRLIGDGAVAVYGMDISRYSQSSLARIAPPEIPYGIWDIESNWRGFVLVSYGSTNLAIYQGSTSGMSLTEIQRRVEQHQGRDTMLLEDEGTTLLIADGRTLAILDLDTAIAGDFAAVHDALVRRSQSAPIGITAAKIRQLGGNFDNWFYVARPIANLEPNPAMSALKHRAEFVSSIEEVSGGLRTGGMNQFYAEATTQKAEDAQTIAGMVRWFFPGVLQMRGDMEKDIAELAELIEGLDARTTGRTASVSFAISDRKLGEVYDREREARKQRYRSAE